MPNLTYKHYHEEYLSKNNGTTAVEVFLALTLILPMAFVGGLIDFVPFLQSNGHKSFPRSAVLEFVIIVIPVIAALTFLSDYLLAFLTAGILCFFLFLLFLQVMVKDAGLPFSKVYNKTHESKKRPFVTYLRAVTNILTALCILAVDFKIFPLRFAKTESYGFSLMDTGVGLFVVLNALVAPEARNVSKRASLYKTLMNSLPLFILGVLRLLVTQKLGYQSQASEYGLHWNFFFTLTFTKIISTSLVTIFPYERAFPVLSVIVITVYETSLNFGLKEWILGDTPRIDFLSSNREGIFSILGYTAIYFSGVSLGQLLLRDNTFTLKKDMRLLLYMIGASGVLWMGTFITDSTLGVSRRLANFGYYIWILTLTISCLGLSLLGEVTSLFVCVPFGRHRGIRPFMPYLFDAVNCHGLLFFLLANVFTGLVNLSIKTLYTGPVESFVILVFYMTVCCGLTSIYHFTKKCELM